MLRQVSLQPLGHRDYELAPSVDPFYLKVGAVGARWRTVLVEMETGVAWQ